MYISCMHASGLYEKKKKYACITLRTCVSTQQSDQFSLAVSCLIYPQMKKKRRQNTTHTGVEKKKRKCTKGLFYYNM